MKAIRTLSTLALAAALSANAFAAPERAGDFALLDQNGDFHQFSKYRNKDAVVILSQANSCAASKAALSQFNELRGKWESQNVAFLLMNSAKDDLASVRKAAQDANIDLPILMDGSQLVAETLKISKAGEVLVLDPQRLSVLYRGPVDSHVSDMLSGGASNVQDTMVMEVSGCDLSVPNTTLAANAPDYATEVAPIIAENCAHCHREGGIGPFAMNSHLMLQGWSPMIREVLMTKRMPPMQVDPNIGHFENANYISGDDLQTLITWIDAGSPKGVFAEDPLSKLQFADAKSWQLGEPDFVVKTPRQEIPATGVMDYINVDVDLPFTEDKWVRAVQFIPGDETVLHHLLTYVTAPSENFDGGEADQRSVARRFLEGYAPGKVDAMVFPEDTGVLIPAGHKLSMQFHFTTNGRATSDETTLGMYFYDEKPAHENFTRSVSTMFVIPPHASNHEVHASYVFNDEVVVNGLRAHMHFRGKDMKFSVEYPDGSMEDLLSVPNYSYAWQPTYQLSEAKLLPAGTKVHVTGAFDNSELNTANPDPDERVTFGLQSWEEMFIGYWTYYETGN
ncbi:MAG: redoxin domain-containing protein [Pseudomonadales bacterium]|nr:redoxin domain-containing protein [Pseudomonadales bacterium]MCP5358891.1 redoxin domain-containing protein [Pseudomonadales bacterium]